MHHNSPSRVLVITSIVVAITAIAVNANWGSGFGFSLFTVNDATSGTKEITDDYVPDGLSASDWDGIRAAHEAGRISSIESISQEAYLKPAAVGTTQADDNFGYSVAISGDTVVVGAPFEDSDTLGVNSTPNENAGDSGAAYVFTRSAGVWTQQAYLKPAAVGFGGQSGDAFGISVAVSGDTVVVGAYGEDSGTLGVNTTPNEAGANSGAAYVFTRSAGVWTQQAYLKPSTVGPTNANDGFGISVAVSGDTVVVGAYLEDSSSTGVNSTPNDTGGINFNSGAAYVFSRSAGVWTQQAYLKPAAVGTTQASDIFGISVGVSGDTVVVGAYLEDSSTTGVNSTPDESSAESGAAYVFTRSAGVWTQQAYLKPAAVGTTQVGDTFGGSVAVSGDTVVVGARQEGSSTTGVNSTPNESATGAGASYVFTRTAGVWTQQAYLKPAAIGTTQANDRFGSAVAVSGDTVVVGAYLEDSSTTGVNSSPEESAAASGAAYVFTRSADVWTQQAYLKPAAVGTTQTTDHFGDSVAVSGDTVIVGATLEDSTTTGVNSTPNDTGGINFNSGAAYVFAGLGPPTPTPTNTATNTPTNTATNTPTETATPTATETFTPTPTPPAVVTGTVTYGNSLAPGPGTRYVPNVSISGAGSPPVSDITTSFGTYSLTGFGAGSYTITPSKSGGQNGAITSFDAARIAQYAVGAISLTAAQQIVADVSGVGGVTSFDASLIARYAASLGPPTGSTGTWIFDPASNMHASINADITGEDYSALLIGDVTGNWGDPSPFRQANGTDLEGSRQLAIGGGPERTAAVQLPTLIASVDKEIIVPVNVQGVADKGVISYEFNLRFDPSVIQPLVDPVDLKDSVSRGLSVVTNATEPGLLRVVVYGAMPIDENGVLLNLRFTAVGKPGSVSPLSFERIMFNEGDPRVTAADGQVEIGGLSSQEY